MNALLLVGSAFFMLKYSINTETLKTPEEKNTIVLHAPRNTQPMRERRTKYQNGLAQQVRDSAT